MTANENSPGAAPKQSVENAGDRYEHVEEGDDEGSCDVRLLFVSGTGLANEAGRPVAGEDYRHCFGSSQ